MLKVCSRLSSFRQYHRRHKKVTSRHPPKATKNNSKKDVVFKKKINTTGINDSNNNNTVWRQKWNNNKDWIEAVGYRLPFFIGLTWLLTEEYPFIGIDAMAGPSMIPTIHPTGDVYLRLVWPFHTQYKVNDVIVLQPDLQKKEYACKRIVATQGMVVKTPNKHNNNNTMDDDDDKEEIIIPDNHVWVEGDFPEYSVDSRNYGPINLKTQCKGQLVLRLFPFDRSQNWIYKTIKPDPPPTVEEVLEQKQKYNLFVVPSKKEGENSTIPQTNDRLK